MPPAWIRLGGTEWDGTRKEIPYVFRDCLWSLLHTMYTYGHSLFVGENCMLCAAREMSSEGESICIMAKAGTQEGRQCSRAVDG